jgi:CRISPR-associated protein (TIGR03984 family)
MVLKIVACSAKVETETIGGIQGSLQEWLLSKTRGYDAWVLAHDAGGVLWGRVRDGKFITAHDVLENVPATTPSLDSATLQQVRVFADDFEGFLWRISDDRWGWRLLYEGNDLADPTYTEAIDEAYLLWGDQAQQLEHDFTLMTDGSQGLAHLLPLPVNSKQTPVKLGVRHYLSVDEIGQAYIATSRLVHIAPK